MWSLTRSHTRPTCSPRCCRAKCTTAPRNCHVCNRPGRRDQLKKQGKARAAIRKYSRIFLSNSNATCHNYFRRICSAWQVLGQLTPICNFWYKLPHARQLYICAVFLALRIRCIYLCIKGRQMGATRYLMWAGLVY